MFDIPLSFVLVSPSVDIFVFIFLFYFLVWKIYKQIILHNPQKIFWIDFQITVILLALGYLNYLGESINLFGIDFSWFIYIIFVQLLAEGLMFVWDRDLIKKLFLDNKKPPAQ